jgi:glycosyltransferase involved in cell wall biosynthesis
LIIAGGHGLHSTEVLAAADANPSLGDRIVYAGYIDEADLACLYSNAMAFIFVPYYEGFGLPPLEAMQCGVPVIASNTSSVPEVVGDAGTLVEPDDEEELLEAILALYRCPSGRAESSAKSLRQSRKFSWAATAEKTAELYRRARRRSRK